MKIKIEKGSIIQVYGCGAYVFNGYDDIILIVEKVNGNLITGYALHSNKLGEIRGNCPPDYYWDGELGKKYIININNVQGISIFPEVKK